MKIQVLHPRTAIINQKQQYNAKMSRLTALSWLRKTFPLAFDSERRIAPLKIGIIHDILAHAEAAAVEGISKSKLREAVVIFTRRIDYLVCLKSREMRINLQGEAIAEVSVEEAEQAALKIKKRIEKSLKTSRAAVASTKSSKINYDNTTDKSSRTLQYAESDLTIEQHHATQAQKTVVVTHKSARTYDKDAVLRLKAKLGLTTADEVM